MQYAAVRVMRYLASLNPGRNADAAVAAAVGRPHWSTDLD
jgi:hypothetical protein